MSVSVAPADERRHRASASSAWNEWWYVDYASDDGFGGFVRLALYPHANVAWYWAYVVGPDLPGPVVVRDHEVPLPRQDALEVRADGLWAESTCETPLEHWTYGLEAFGVRLDDPLDAYRGEIGERMPVGFDLEWELRTPAFRLGEGSQYEQFGSVRGEVLLGRERIEVDGFGTRAHGWGDGHPWRVGEVHGSFQAGSSFGLAIAGERGAQWAGGAEVVELSDVRSETSFDDRGLPTAARIVVDHAFAAAVDVVAVVPVPIDETMRLSRALCRAELRGGAASALGWLEWARSV